jgi:hypothetical protein
VTDAVLAIAKATNDIPFTTFIQQRQDEASLDAKAPQQNHPVIPVETDL